MIEFAFLNKTLLKNVCGYRGDFLTIESGKTLTFIVKEFLNDFACKQRASDRVGEKGRKCEFYAGILRLACET